MKVGDEKIGRRCVDGAEMQPGWSRVDLVRNRFMIVLGFLACVKWRGIGDQIRSKLIEPNATKGQQLGQNTNTNTTQETNESTAP